MNSGKSSIVVLVLAMSLMLSLIFVSNYNYQHPPVIAVAKISEAQAIKVVEKDLSDRSSNYRNLSVFVSGIGYKPPSEFGTNNYHLPLVFSHPNGTLFYINSTTHTVDSKCTPSGDIANCSWSRLFAEKSKGRLVYGVDIYWFDQKGIATSDFYLVNAANEDIVFSFISQGHGTGKPTA